LQLLQQDPLLDQISAILKPGLRLGESKLSIKVKEARPYQVGLALSNDRSPSIGAENGRIWGIHRNLTGFGDRLYASFNLSEGLHNYAVSYSFPITAYDTRLQFSYDNSDSEIITQFTQSESEPKISGESEMYEFSLYQPIYQTPQQALSVTLAFQHRRSQSFLGDIGFAFSSGVESNGKSKISALRFTQDWISRSQNQVIAFRSRLSFGLDAFDATINSSGPDGKFFTWLGQIQWLRQLPLFNSQLLARVDIQFSADPLLPLEKFSVGGQYSVRGYRENQLVRDNGISTSLEWRVPVFNLPLPILSKPGEGQVQLAAFFDFGWSENIDLPSPNPKTISSAGLGVRWNPSRKIHSQLYWAVPFRKIDNNPHNLQDSGIHFRVSMELF
jgi:hemolysin activation/secretion protein